MRHRLSVRALSLAAIAALAALAPAAAAQQPAAQGTISGSGTQYTLVIQNTGAVQLRCMRLFTRVDVTGATGPGQTRVEGPRVFASQNFQLAPGGSAEWAFTTAQPYPENGGGDLRISADCQQDAAAPVTGPAPQQPGPQPVVGRTEVITVLRGTVLVRRRGTRRFVRVTGTQSIPDRSEIDTKRGALRLTVANGSGGTETADVAEGRAVVDQDTAARPLTTLRLSEPLACPDSASGSATAAQRSRRPKRRRIYVKTVGGNVKTKGRYAEAIARGTAWRTNDQCNATIIQVLEGTVEVTSRAGRVTVTAPRRVVVVRRRPR